MGEVASCIAQVLADHASEANLAAVRARVKKLTDKFPLYRWKSETVGA
jgi:glycine/serine hydroxymethyltransferase